MWEYTDKVREHFLNPRNVGEVENPDGVGEVGSIACGDALKLTFKLDENKRIKDAKFKTFGCASAIASSSALTEMIKGMTLEEAAKVTNQDIADLPGRPARGEDALLASWGGRRWKRRSTTTRAAPAKEPGAKIVCECFGVTDREIERAVRENNLTTVEEVTNYTKAGGGCGNCHDAIQADHRPGARPRPNRRSQPKLTNIQKIKMIEETLEREIRPSLKHDGGDIELIDVDGNRVLVAMRGACASCKASEHHPEALRRSEAAGAGFARPDRRGGGPMKTVYLDNNATTQVAPEVLEAMLPYFRELYGNPSSMHTFGGQVGREDPRGPRAGGRAARRHPDEIIFTSCGTESDNAAIRSALATNPDKRHIVTSRVEHPAVKALCAHLAGQGYRVTELPVDKNGLLDLEQYWRKPHARHGGRQPHVGQQRNRRHLPRGEGGRAGPGTGHPVPHRRGAGRRARSRSTCRQNAIDMLSLSGHKLHAPKGIGVLYVRKGTKFSPFLIGGHQEKGRRGGTENTPSIIGLGKACELAAQQHGRGEHARSRRLRDRLETALLTRIPNSRVNGDTEQRLPNTTNISFEFVEGEAILLLLDEYGICASSGSACTSGSLQPSHVLRAMGVPFTMAHGSIRFSLSVYNTEEEIDFVIEKLPPIIERLRGMSPYWTPSARPA